MKLPFLSAAILSLLTVAGLSAQAQVQKEKDWQLEKGTEALLSTQSCIASTTVASSKISVKTELIFPQGEDKAPLIVLKAHSLAGQTAKAYLRPDSKTQYPLLLVSSDASTGEDTFVLSPMRMTEALQIIAEKSILDVYFGEGATAVLARISLRGSSVTLNRTAACRNSRVLLKESLFNELKKDTQLAQSQNGTVQDLLAAYQDTFKQLNERDANQLKLVNHQKAGAQVLAQQKAAADAQSLALRREQDTQNTVATLTKKISDLQARIQKAGTDLPQFQAQRPGLQSALAAAEKAIAPLTPNVERLENEVNYAAGEESRISQNISGLQSQLASLQQEERNLEAETDSARRQQQSKQSDIQNINGQIANLQFQYQNFDEQRETERILRDSFDYRNAHSELDRWTRLDQELPAQIEQARREVADADRALRTCQSSQPPPAPPLPHEPPPQPVPDPQDPHHPPHHVPPPHPRPERENASVSNLDMNLSSNCSSEESRLRQAQNELNSKISDRNQATQQIHNYRVRITEIEQEAQQEARQIRGRIASQINELRQDQQSLQNEISSLDAKIRDIQQIDIPRKVREMDSKRIEISNAQSQLSSAQANTRKAQFDLDQYKRSVGYDQLEQNVSNAETQLDNLDAAIAADQSVLKNGPAQVTAAQNDLVNQQQELVRRTAARQQADTGLASANAAVSAHQAEEVRLSDAVNTSQALLLAARQLTQGLSKALYGF